MDTAIQIVWSIGLVGALVLTLVILKEVALLLRVLVGIHRLSERIRVAAEGIASNLGPVPALAGIADPLGRIHGAAQGVAVSAGALNREMETLSPPARES